MSSAVAFSGIPPLCAVGRSQRGRNSPQVSQSRRDVCRLGAALFASKAFSAQACVSDPEQTSNERSDNLQKQLFAQGMETGMVAYEKSIAGVKQNLFSQISQSEQVADVGIGTGPNLPYLRKGTHVVGVDPNKYMWPYAMEKARTNGIDLRVVEGVCEKLPLEDRSYDVVIMTLTLCSVQSPSQAINEILRVLKPDGRLFFIEHVIADPSRPIFRAVQNLLNPLQVALSDGCHLNRDTARILQETREPGFSEIKYDEFDIGGVLNPIRPHIAGYARKESP